MYNIFTNFYNNYFKSNNNNNLFLNNVTKLSISI